MAEAPRRYAYNNNRLFIEELNESPTNQFLNLNTNTKQVLPAIRDATPVNTNTNLLPRSNSSAFNASIDLNNTQQKLKQLESRLQVTEVSNRALLEEVIRLQNELAISLRRSFDTIAEERNARQIIENNYKFQTENVLQLNGRIKRAEDSLQEDRNAMQSLIVYTRNLEQTLLNAQKDLFVRRDFQAQRLDDLKIQIDELQYSKDNLERSASTLLEEIKSLKSKVDLEALSLNTISGDLRNKTRRLEDENRQHMDVMRKHQDTMALTENNLISVRSQLENKINEIRDMNIDLKNRIENEREEKRSYEQHLNLKFSELSSLINEEKHKYNESMRTLDALKREFYQNIDNERSRLSSIIADAKDSVLLVANDKIEKAKEDFLNRLKDAERSISDESEKRSKQQQNIKDNFELKLENVKRLIEEQVLFHRNETRDSALKAADSIKKLNEGMNLIELQSEERSRKFEQVIGAEIKARKNGEKDMIEKLNVYNEKFTYAMQSFQTTVGNLSTRLTEAKEQFVNRKEIETIEKKHERLQAEQAQTDIQINSIKESIKLNSTKHEEQVNKLKEISDTTNRIENVTIPSINTRLGQLPTKEDLNSVKLANEDKINDEMKKIIKQNDLQHAELKLLTENRINDINTQISSFSTKFNKKLDSTEKLVKDQIAAQNEYQLKNMLSLREETKKSLKEYEELNDKNLQDLERKIDNLRNENQINNNTLTNRVDLIENEVEKNKGNISDWKKNINLVIEEVKKDQDDLTRDQNQLEVKISNIKEEQNKKLTEESRSTDAEIYKLREEIQGIKRSLNAPKDTIESEINKLNHSIVLNNDKLKEDHNTQQTEINNIWKQLNEAKS